jgi:AcrR family transcriptional regulator
VKRTLPSGRHGLSPEYVAAHQRARLLAAGCEVCAERSYAEASIAEIVRRAGVSTRSFYRHFDSKQACFLAALAAAAAELEAAVVASLDGDAAASLEAARGARTHSRSSSARAAVLAPAAVAALALRAVLDELCAHPQLARTLFVDALCAGPAALRQRAAALEHAQQLLPVPAGVPTQAREAALGGVAETIYHAVLEGSLAELAARWEELAYCLLVGLVGHDGALAACSEAGAQSRRRTSTAERGEAGPA